jgi:hypothetical protein
VRGGGDAVELRQHCLLLADVAHWEAVEGCVPVASCI